MCLVIVQHDQNNAILVTFQSLFTENQKLKFHWIKLKFYLIITLLYKLEAKFDPLSNPEEIRLHVSAVFCNNFENSIKYLCFR